MGQYLLLLFCLTVPSYARAESPFLWGAAWSAHQTEGWSGGGEKSDWASFKTKAGETSEVAIDHWNRYPEDIEWSKKLGLNTVRTSVSWEKIEPAPGVFNEEVLSHYRREFQLMREKGLRPMIALQHFVHPKWFHEKGGWLSNESPLLFLRFAEKVVSSLGEYCDLWITFNEPMVQVIMGYLKGESPPYLKGLQNAFEAAYQIARAHRMVTAMIHEKQGFSPNAMGVNGQTRGVGLANSLHLYTPSRDWHPKDVKAAQVLSDLNNWAFLKGVLSDRLRFEIPELEGGQVFERAFPLNDVSPIHLNSSFMDWVGVNYYTRYEIKYSIFNSLRAEWVVPKTKWGHSDLGWALDPEGLKEILKETSVALPKLPLIVTENGLADSTDSKRPEFIQLSLASLDQARKGNADPEAHETPLDVRGYYHWSLFDNFEWLYGYGPRFGLIEIDYAQNLKRSPRRSFEVYREEILRRSFLK